MQEKLVKICTKTFGGISAIGCVFLISFMMVTIANIILRRFFNSPIHGSTEMIQYLALLTACLAIVETEWSDSFPSLTILTEKLPTKAYNIMMSVVFTINSILFVVLSTLFFSDLQRRFALGTITPELGIPRWIFSLVLALGIIGLTLALVAKTILYYRSIKTGERLNFFQIAGRSIGH